MGLRLLEEEKQLTEDKSFIRPRRTVSEFFGAGQKPVLEKETLAESAKISLDDQLKALKSIPRTIKAGLKLSPAYMIATKGKYLPNKEDIEAVKSTVSLPLKTIARIPSAIQAGMFPLKGKSRMESATQAFLRPEALPAGYSGGEIAKRINPKLWPVAGGLGTIADIISFQIGTGNISKQLIKGYRASKVRGATQELETIVDKISKPTVKVLEKQNFFPKEWNNADKLGRTKLWVREQLANNPRVGDFLIKKQKPLLRPLMGEAGKKALPKVGDIVTLGKEQGKVISLTGTKAILNVGGKQVPANISEIKVGEKGKPLTAAEAVKGGMGGEEFVESIVGKGKHEVLYHKIGTNNIEIIKNPTPSDVRQMTSEFKKQFPEGKGEPAIRTTYDNLGNKYIFRSDKSTHGDVEPFLRDKFGIDLSQDYDFPRRKLLSEYEAAKGESAEQFIRTATKLETTSQSAKNTAFNSFPKKEGMQVVYKPYGEQGKGFYYVPETGRVGFEAEQPAQAPIAPPAKDLQGEQPTEIVSSGQESIHERLDDLRNRIGDLEQGAAYGDPEDITQLEDLRNEYAILEKKSEEFVKSIADKLSKMPSKGKIKSLVRKVTGQVRIEEPIITERQGLKRSLKRQEQAAGIASRQTKKTVKEMQSLLKKIKAEPIQSMGYEERNTIEGLKEELRITRTLDGLRNLYSRIQTIKDQGKLKYKATVESKNAQFELDKELLLKTIATKPPKKPSLKIKGRHEPKSVPKTLRASTLRLPRVLDKLDGGQNFQGPWHQYFYDRTNRAVNQELKGYEKRHDAMMEFLKSKKISIDDLSKKRMVDSIEMTLDEILSLYTAMKNTEKLSAILYGNEIPLMTIKKAISTLSPQEKELAEMIILDYKNNWERVRRTFIDYTDGKYDLGKVSGYTPLKRMFPGRESSGEELVKEMLERENLRKAYVARAFTKKRVHISPEHEIPIKLGEMSIWLEQVRKQEHFISHGNLVREMQKIVGNKDIRDAINNGKGFGPEYYEVLQNAVNRIANPSIYKAFTQIEKIGSTLRSNAAIAYLGLNLTTMMKQFPSYFLFLSDAEFTDLLAGIHEMTTNYKESMKLIDRLSPQIKHRSIERELEELKKMDYGKYRKILKAVGKNSMRGIYMIDKIAVRSGWLAVYNKKLKEGLSEEMAAEVAEKSILRTQPAAHPKDIADIYASNEFLNWFTQFTNQLNQIYNILTYDIPMKAKTGRYWDATRAAIGIIISQYLIASITRGRPLRKEEVTQDMSQNLISTIPVAGPLIVSGLKGFNALPPALSGVNAGTQALKYMLKEKYGKALEKGAEAGAVLGGVPFAQPRRTFKGIQDIQSGKTKDPRRLIWSEYGLREPSKKKKKYKLSSRTAKKSKVKTGKVKTGNLRLIKQ